MIKYLSKSENDTLKFASKLSESVFKGAIILLAGNLGAGKTVFVRGFVQGLNSSDLVMSPTYNIMYIYQGRMPLVHFDLFRLKSDEDFYDIGGDEYLGGNNICAVEWYENCKDAMGNEYLKVKIEDTSEDERLIKLIPKGKKYKKWLDNIKDDINT